MIYSTPSVRRAPYFAPMESEAQKLRRDLERYRFLVGRINDPRAIKVLMALIGEGETRLHVLERSDGARSDPS